MKTYKTVHELVLHTKNKIDELHLIVDFLLQEFKSFSLIIDGEKQRKTILKKMIKIDNNTTALVESFSQQRNQLKTEHTNIVHFNDYK